MTLDEAYLEVMAEMEWRAENPPGAAYYPEEVDIYISDAAYDVIRSNARTKMNEPSGTLNVGAVLGEQVMHLFRHHK